MTKHEEKQNSKAVTEIICAVESLCNISLAALISYYITYPLAMSYMNKVSKNV